MTDLTSEQRTILSEDMIFGVRRRERLAWTVAIGGMSMGLIGVVTTALVLPLKETQAFLAIVDKDTGIAERAVTIEAAGMQEAPAMQQALAYAYVTDRETFDEADNDARILAVWRRSDGQAKTSLQELWNEDATDYPPSVFGSGARSEIKVIAINLIGEGTAQVRYEKVLRQPGGKVQTGKFTATLGWKFVPRIERDMKLVWENPLGFTVTSYRVTADSYTTGD